MAYLTQVTVTSSYASAVLPALLILGLGFGMIFAPAINTATTGVAREDSGVASALVNTMQQVGGSIGTSALSTIALTATASYLVAHHASPLAPAIAATHGYTTAFAVSAGLLGLGFILAIVLLPSRRRLAELRAASAAAPAAPAPAPAARTAEPAAPAPAPAGAALAPAAATPAPAAATPAPPHPSMRSRRFPSRCAAARRWSHRFADRRPKRFANVRRAQRKVSRLRRARSCPGGWPVTDAAIAEVEDSGNNSARRRGRGIPDDAGRDEIQASS